MIVATRMSRADWERYEIRGNWWIGFSLEWHEQWLYVRLLGFEVSICWGVS